MFRTPVPTKILRIVNEAEKVKTFYLHDSNVAKKSKPGNFLLVWVPFPADYQIEKPENLEQLDQLPMSISYADPVTGTFAITVKEMGLTTSELHKYSEGQELGIIGPLGNSFSSEAETCILIGGGIGIAPLRFLASSLASKKKKLIGFMGFRTKNEVLFESQMKKIFDRLTIVTDDGSYGEKAFVTSVFEEYLDKTGLRDLGPKSKVMVYSCGPELMIKRVFDICERFGLPIEVSLERFIHCGRGICGFCSIDGYRVCREGPIFQSDKLRNIKDLGICRRSSSGKRERI
jgi:dihydroorotate dehydrogenase electron transfer subunit